MTGASALDAEGVSHDLPAVLADRRLAARVHERLPAWLRDPPEPEPDTPEEFRPYARPPGVRAGWVRYRRAARRRRRSAPVAAVPPWRRRVTGRRGRG